MKVLEIIPNLQGGGAENFLVSLSNEFVKNKDIDVTLLTLYPTDKKDKILINKISPNIKFFSLKKKKGMDIKVFFDIYKYIKSNKFDIVHFHINAISYSLLSTILYKKCKYFATIHNDAYKEATGIHRVIRKALFCLGLAQPITISDDSNRSFNELYKVDAEVIYNGVSSYSKKEEIALDKYKKTPNTKIFVNVASVQPSKNQVKIARVFNRLAQDGEDVTILFIGRITDAHKAFAEEFKKELSQHAQYIGEDCNPRDYMVKADYFVLASHYEGLPITLLESLSVGCIPIVTAVGGNINIVKDEYNGFIIEDANEKAIYTTIKRVLKTEAEKTARIKKKTEDSFPQYTIEKCAEKHLALFKSKLNTI